LQKVGFEKILDLIKVVGGAAWLPTIARCSAMGKPFCSRRCFWLVGHFGGRPRIHLRLPLKNVGPLIFYLSDPFRLLIFQHLRLQTYSLGMTLRLGRTRTNGILSVQCMKDGCSSQSSALGTLRFRAPLPITADVGVMACQREHNAPIDPPIRAIQFPFMVSCGNEYSVHAFQSNSVRFSGVPLSPKHAEAESIR
jgi:hypothetical protein